MPCYSSGRTWSTRCGRAHRAENKSCTIIRLRGKTQLLISNNKEDGCCCHTTAMRSRL
ncbi:hypothetical protein OESDEN_22115 [Oesophagostomum dentatum]|uniref:Uncharacterized protein n=1 Tax=Oesophagostomum dentatum TaxID=61180 RepID=A0A0B1S4X4_OESDE|nr:hypothetical protein OESDEN_22115 [Oesophagostomum dentatum]